MVLVQAGACSLGHNDTFRLRPLSVSRDCIRELVALLAQHDEVKAAAFIEGRDAWCRGATFQQGVWRRARRELRRRIAWE